MEEYTYLSALVKRQQGIISILRWRFKMIYDMLPADFRKESRDEILGTIADLERHWANPSDFQQGLIEGIKEYLSVIEPESDVHMR